MSTIFVRERSKECRGTGRPRFVIVATLGTDLRVFARHVRKAELEKLAEAAGAALVYLPRGEGENAGEKEDCGDEDGRGRQRHRQKATEEEETSSG